MKHILQLVNYYKKHYQLNATNTLTPDISVSIRVPHQKKHDQFFFRFLIILLLMKVSDRDQKPKGKNVGCAKPIVFFAIIFTTQDCAQKTMGYIPLLLCAQTIVPFDTK